MTTIKKKNLSLFAMNLFQIPDCLFEATFCPFGDYNVVIGVNIFEKLLTHKLFSLEFQVLQQDKGHSRHEDEQAIFRQK